MELTTGYTLHIDGQVIRFHVRRPDGTAWQAERALGRGGAVIAQELNGQVTFYFDGKRVEGT